MDVVKLMNSLTGAGDPVRRRGKAHRYVRSKICGNGK